MCSAIACLLLIGVLLVPVVAWANQTTATVTTRMQVFQEYKVPVSGLQNSFEYVIAPVEEDAPLPIDASGKTFDRFTLRREESLWLEFPVSVAVDPSATPYAYHYVLAPAQKTLEDGLHYVDALSTSLEAGVNEYLLEIYVQPSNTDAADSMVVPLVHVDAWDGPKVTDPGWRVGYTASVDEDDSGKPDAPDSKDDETVIYIDGKEESSSGNVPASEVIKPTDEGDSDDEKESEEVQHADSSGDEDDEDDEPDEPSDDDETNSHVGPDDEEEDAEDSEAGGNKRAGNGGSASGSGSGRSSGSSSGRVSGDGGSSVTSTGGSGATSSTRAAERSSLAQTGDESGVRPIALAAFGVVILVEAARLRRHGRAGEENA
ncbi:MAG: hypothetical protein IKG18_15680 [Atopobiaceae bacterium]|nr:hypothetical protein [Atopobiaceae bacterium]MBR3315568.1 hypothetical protein [Atopobiaceae bacterium]